MHWFSRTDLNIHPNGIMQQMNSNYQLFYVSDSYRCIYQNDII